MGKIVCLNEGKCGWPNCSCTWAESPVEQRKALPPGANRPRYSVTFTPPTVPFPDDAAPYEEANPVDDAIAAGLLPPVAPAGMYAGTKHQSADPERMRAVLADEFGPIIGSAVHPLIPAYGTPHEPKKPNVPFGKVIPIAQANEPAKFDADIIEIMLREAGAVTEGFYIVIKKRETLEKLAEALNNLGT